MITSFTITDDPTEVEAALRQPLGTVAITAEVEWHDEYEATLRIPVLIDAGVPSEQRSSVTVTVPLSSLYALQSKTQG